MLAQGAMCTSSVDLIPFQFHSVSILSLTPTPSGVHADEGRRKHAYATPSTFLS